MNSRRSFFNVVTAGVATLGTQSLANANSTSALPAVINLLLDDDSGTVDCSDVNCNGYSVSLIYSGAQGEVDLLMDTPGGTRLIADGFNANVTLNGQCNDWKVGYTESGSMQGVSLSLVGTTINQGQYQLFLSNNSSTTMAVRVEAASCNNFVGTAVQQDFIADTPVSIGSINVTESGFAEISIFGASNV